MEAVRHTLHGEWISGVSSRLNSLRAIKGRGRRGTQHWEQHTLVDTSGRKGMAGVDECIQLLQGPSDEKRFVGLLLVAKLLPSEDYNVALKIWEAIGSRFLRRMLVPVTRVSQVHAPHPSDESTEVHLMSCSVATTILDSFCRFKELVEGTDVMDFIPLIVQVWRNRSRIHAWAVNVDEQVESNILLDILGTLFHVSITSKTGRQKVADCNGIEVASTSLQELKGVKCQQNLLAAQLLGSLLGEKRLEQLQVENLAHLLDLSDPTEVPSASQTGKHCDPVVLQLEALHALLMILPVPLPQASDLQYYLEQSVSRWASKMRNGIAALLQSRSTPVQRHSALKLAAAMTELCGALWLVGLEHSSPKSEKDSQLFQLVVEIVKVEISVLLHDAAGIGVKGSPEVGPQASCSTAKIEISPQTSNEHLGAGDAAQPKSLEVISTCFWLLENILSVLVEREQIQEGFSDDVHDACAFLDDKIAARAMGNVSDCIGYILEYVSETSSSSSGHSDENLLAACARCIGRFLAEVPMGHKDSVMRCLEVLVCCGEGFEGAGFLVPGLLQITEEEDKEHWLSSCLQPSVLQAFFKRAAVLAAGECDISERSSSIDPRSLEVTPELGATCHLLSNILWGSNEVPPAVKETVVETSMALAVFLLSGTGIIRNTIASVVVDVALLLVSVSRLFVASSEEKGFSPVLEQCCRAAVRAIEICYGGFLESMEDYQEVLGDRWQELIRLLTVLAEESIQSRQAMRSIATNSTLQNVCQAGSRNVEIVSLQMFLKHLKI